MKKIVIKQDYKNDYITRIAGERLRQSILESQQMGEPVEIDQEFRGRKLPDLSVELGPFLN